MEIELAVVCESKHRTVHRVRSLTVIITLFLYFRRGDRPILVRFLNFDVPITMIIVEIIAGVFCLVLVVHESRLA